VPPNLLLQGYLQKKSSSGSTFRPWGERLVEIKANGTLTYRSEKKKKKATSSRDSFSSSSPGGVGIADDPEQGDDLTISLCNVSVVPLSRKRAGRDFAFEVKGGGVSAGQSSPSSPGGGGAAAMTPTSPGAGGGPAESLTLAAGSAQEGAQWIKAIQSAAVTFTEATVGRRRQQGAEVGDAMQVLEVMGSSWEASTREKLEDEALNKAAADASLAEEESRKKRREDEEEAMLQQAMKASEEAHTEHQSTQEQYEAEDRAQMLQALLLSSDMYAQQLHGTADEQKGRTSHRLAYDSYKLAVSFYLKCQALADELGHDSKHVDGATMSRIQSDLDASMASADECFLKSHAAEKKKKRKTETGSGHKHHHRRSTKGATAKAADTAAVPTKISFGGETGPAAATSTTAESVGMAAVPRRSSLASASSNGADSADDDAAWFDGGEIGGAAGAGVDAAAAAAAAANGGLPPGWEEHLSDDGTPYYHNEETGETSWEKPAGSTSLLVGSGGVGGVDGALSAGIEALDLDAVVEGAVVTTVEGSSGGGGGHLSSDDDDSSEDSSSEDSDDSDDDEGHRTERRATRRATRRASKKAGRQGQEGGVDDGLSALRDQVGAGLESLPDFGASNMAQRATLGFSTFLGNAQLLADKGAKENEAGSSDDDSDGSSSSGSESDYEDESSGSISSAASPSASLGDRGSISSSVSGGDGEVRARSLSLRASEGESKGRVIMELIESERRYLVILEQIVHVSEWLQQETGAVKPKDHGTLFQGAAQLLDLSKGFLKDIDDQLNGEKSFSADGGEEIFLEDLKMGALLNKYMPFFKIYTIYSDTYDDKQARLKELVGDGSTDFAKYLRAAMEDKEISGEFQSLLIQPIQRVPRYKMLLERMVANIEKSEPDDTDLPLLKKSFVTISGVAMHINQSLRRQVDTLKLLELQSCFFPPVVFVAPGRRLIKKGELEKIADKNNSKQKYVFFLFNDALAYGAKLFGGYYRFHRMLNVTGMDELSMTDHTTNRFRITAEERNLTLQAKTFEDKKAWVTAIAEKMNEKHANADTFARARSASEAIAQSTTMLFGSSKSGGGAGKAGNSSNPAMMTMTGFDWQSNTSGRDESPERDGANWKKNKRKTLKADVNTF